MSNLEPKLVDVRTIKRNIERGLLSAQDYQDYLDSLEDSAEFSAPSEVVFTYSDNQAQETNEAAVVAAPAQDAEASNATARKAKPRRKRTTKTTKRK